MSRFHPYYRRSHAASAMGGFLAVFIMIIICCLGACVVGCFASIGADATQAPGYPLQTATQPANPGK